MAFDFSRNLILAKFSENKVYTNAASTVGFGGFFQGTGDGHLIFK